MKSDIIKDFSLPNYVKDKSFAEASKAIDNKFKDREDQHSQATKKELLSRLAKAQEHIKMKDQLKEETLGQNQMMDGGMVAMAVNQGMDIANGMFGDTGVNTSAPVQRQEEKSMLMESIKLGGIPGIISANRHNRDVREANQNLSLMENNQFSNDFSGGGTINKLGTINFEEQGQPLDFTPGTHSLSGKKSPMSVLGTPSFNPELSKGLDSNEVGATIQNLANARNGFGQKVADFTKENYGDILNTAPIGVNAYQLAKLKKATPVSYDRLDAKYKHSQVDERALENKVQNEASNTIRGLANATNGSAGALRSGMLAAQLNKTNALSDAYLKATDMNNQDTRFGQQFNAQQNAMNLRTSIMETNERRADDAAYEQAKADMIDRLGTNIGDFGKQQMYKKMAIKATDYGWDGKYYVNKNTGHTMTAAEYKAQFGTKTQGTTDDSQ